MQTGLKMETEKNEKAFAQSRKRHQTIISQIEEAKTDEQDVRR